MRASKIASIALFRTMLLSFVRLYWRPVLAPGSRPVPDGPCFLYGNHSNRWDPFVLNCFTAWGRPTAGLMTREFFRKPFLRWALRSLDLHPTRKGTAEPSLVRSVHELLAQGQAIVIYPEGQSRWAGRPGPWIETTAKVFAKYGYPVYPVITHGSYVTWPRWATYPRPGRVEVQIGDPISLNATEPLTDTLRKLQGPIDADENVVEERLRPRWAYRPADGIHRLLYRDPESGAYRGLFSPDGSIVTNRSGSLRFTMRPDSQLVDDRTGTATTTADLYDTIRSMPWVADANGTILQDEVEVSTEVRFPDLVDEGAFDVRLTDSSIEMNRHGDNRSIALERILSFDIERNYKLQLTLDDDTMVQMAFTGNGSALAWADALASVLK